MLMKRSSRNKKRQAYGIQLVFRYSAVPTTSDDERMATRRLRISWAIFQFLSLFTLWARIGNSPYFRIGNTRKLGTPLAKWQDINSDCMSIYRDHGGVGRTNRWNYGEQDCADENSLSNKTVLAQFCDNVVLIHPYFLTRVLGGPFFCLVCAPKKFGIRI